MCYFGVNSFGLRVYCTVHTVPCLARWTGRRAERSKTRLMNLVASRSFPSEKTSFTQLGMRDKKPPDLPNAESHYVDGPFSTAKPPSLFTWPRTSSFSLEAGTRPGPSRRAEPQLKLSCQTCIFSFHLRYIPYCTVLYLFLAHPPLSNRTPIFPILPSPTTKLRTDDG